jgi:hypothetical protein
MASNIPTRQQPQAQSTTITPKSSKVQKQPSKGGSTLAERAADSFAGALSRRKSAVQNKRLRRQTIGYSIPKTPVTPSRVLKRQSITPTAIPIRVSQQNKGQRTPGNTILITSTTTSHRGVCSKSSGHQRNLRPRRRSSMPKVSPDSSEFNPFPHSDATKPHRFRGRYHKQ